ncbi:iron(III) transport system ATP-binding protein [Nocardioides alpinus]|uniref:ABC-type quaternary amine transporter n=1 Tax=Nocardioides alpinus TaxID=748909 RepID=A0A1I1AE80_9ACTN|nr:ABC transporter ATP-binding protein [Nocardioides alpinus]PKH43438.1 ABC transporter ATP-binding protein [Nocardioides alpinus]SFB34770.1 iron(III) transport system ATP-binding protein [Nocardioides alpinus]
MSSLTLTGVTKSFADTRAVDDVTLHVPHGSFTTVLGPSGCGKTTLLRLIAGFLVPESGSIAFGDHVVCGDGVRPVPPQTRRVGYVPQEGALFPHLDVAANIAFGLPREARGTQSGDRVAEMLDLVELPADFRSRRPDELSGGQQQRVALARSLAPQPAVVLLDEPFSSLDAGLRGSTARAVRRALEVTHTTAVLVTHDQNEALSLADQVAVMRGGRLVQSATPSEVYLSPSDPQVAAFVGRAVVLPGIATAAHATCALGQVVLTEPSDGPVSLMIRPEQVYVDLAHPEGERAGVRGTVEEVSYYGHDCAVQVRLADGTAVLSRMSGVLHPAAGDTVHLRVTGLVRAYRPAEAP